MPRASYDPATGQLLGTQRTIYDIYISLVALTTTQKNNIWTDFTSGTPPKWTQADGENRGGIAAASIMAIDMPTGTAYPVSVQTLARLKMVAAYVADYPRYLVNPSFDTSISVPGYTNGLG